MEKLNGKVDRGDFAELIYIWMEQTENHFQTGSYFTTTATATATTTTTRTIITYYTVVKFV